MLHLAERTAHTPSSLRSQEHSGPPGNSTCRCMRSSSSQEHRAARRPPHGTPSYRTPSSLFSVPRGAPDWLQPWPVRSSRLRRNQRRSGWCCRVGHIHRPFSWKRRQHHRMAFPMTRLKIEPVGFRAKEIQVPCQYREHVDVYVLRAGASVT